MDPNYIDIVAGGGPRDTVVCGTGRAASRQPHACAPPARRRGTTVCRAARPACMLVTAALVAAIPLPARATAGEASPIRFPTSAGPAAQALFEQGVAWLHSFEYERALEAFQAAQQAEPGFALAYWGEALCYHQTLWLNEDLGAGRAALSRLGPTPAARARKAPTARERAYLAAVETLFGPGDALARRAAYARAMADLAERHPDDDEAAVLYGLALLGTVSRGRALSPGSDVETPLLAGSDVQRRAARIFQGVLRRNPRHPGALHYLIHAYDDPDHAALALDAARAYPAVAPESSHARHMPAHIFVQLGRWHDAAAADESAFAASERWVASRGLPPSMKDFHALSWLAYEYLQLGRRRDARAIVDRMGREAAAAGAPRLHSIHATMRAREAIETEDWNLLRTDTSRNDHELFAIGVSAVGRGDLAVAGQVQAFLDEMVASPRYQDRRRMLEILRHELGGLLALAAGREAEGLARLREALALERALPPSLGPVVPIKPASELLGEALLARGRPDEARRLFAESLGRAPGRSRSLLGLARAEARLGNGDASRTAYEALFENWRRADPDLPDLAEVRQALETTKTSAGPASAGRPDPSAASVDQAPRGSRAAGGEATGSASPEAAAPGRGGATGASQVAPAWSLARAATAGAAVALAIGFLAIRRARRRHGHAPVARSEPGSAGAPPVAARPERASRSSKPRVRP
jgi:tetratricopeptide (TPR) repeat protein